MKPTKQKTRKKKSENKFILIKLMCGHCGEVFISSEPRWRGWANDCEMCGSHGGVEVTGHCPKCTKEVTVEVYGW